MEHDVSRIGRVTFYVLSPSILLSLSPIWFQNYTSTKLPPSLAWERSLFNRKQKPGRFFQSVLMEIRTLKAISSVLSLIRKWWKQTHRNISLIHKHILSGTVILNIPVLGYPCQETLYCTSRLTVISLAVAFFMLEPVFNKNQSPAPFFLIFGSIHIISLDMAKRDNTEDD